jgi:hypothetical protein
VSPLDPLRRTWSLSSRNCNYERRYQKLRKAFTGIGFVCSGSVAAPRYNYCGKANCRCQGDPPQPHGPYFQWTAKVDGKTVNRRLRPPLATGKDSHGCGLADEVVDGLVEPVELAFVGVQGQPRDRRSRQGPGATNGRRRGPNLVPEGRDLVAMGMRCALDNPVETRRPRS